MPSFNYFSRESSSNMKSERLKKLESELRDLEQWLKLGLVPKKDVEKHKEEIRSLQGKIEEEKDRLQFLKESGEIEEYTTPRRHPARQAAYPDTSSIPDIDMTEESGGLTDAGLEMETETIEAEGFSEERADDSEEPEDDDDDDEDPFSDRNRWRRGVLDPDADDW
ncbi:MAG: hypothetical protein JHC93_03195 [Parachlamydiales bacterium]|nr:hypothetical protein [Parachlamydiales bacterium]